MAGSDDIAGLLRFRDRIKMEVRTLRRHTAAAKEHGDGFHLDVSALKPVTGKIGAASAAAGLSEEAAATRRANVELVKSTIAAKARGPTEKYALPPTASLEIGWFAAQHTSLSQPYKYFVHKKSDIAQYGEDYSSVFSAGPYDKTQPVAR